MFHGGTGATLEMREFGLTSLKQKLLGAGFEDVNLLSEDVPSCGIHFDSDVSQPLIARKKPFRMERRTVSELIDQWRHETAECDRLREESNHLKSQIKMAGESRWLKLGRTLHAGPHFRVD